MNEVDTREEKRGLLQFSLVCLWDGGREEGRKREADRTTPFVKTVPAYRTVLLISRHN